jgi:hypothetical protein
MANERGLPPSEPEQIQEDDVVDVNERAEVLPFKYSITSFGADFPVDGLVARMERGDIIVPSFDSDGDVDSTTVEGFQREFVWTRTQMERFIESLLLGLPVPGIFLAQQSDNVLLVVDGQQRLRTLQYFYREMPSGAIFRLRNVQDEFRDKTYRDLDLEDRRRLDNTLIHATIFRQDQPTDDQSSIYSIFERLNTGGTPLQAQEIRVAMFRGPFVALLRELNRTPSWRSLYRAPSKRLKDQELILRFFAFLYEGENYARPMKTFLNNYMGRNQHLAMQNAEMLRRDFSGTCDVILQSIGEDALRPEGPTNAAVADSIMVSIAKRLRSGPIGDAAMLRSQYDALIADANYHSAVVATTAGEESVRQRMAFAERAFADVR